MKIYTKTGDKGKTSLFNGARVYKNNIRVEAYGTVDELNSVIGIVLTQVKSSKLKLQNDGIKFKTTLIAIQNMLFEIGACLANPTVKTNTKIKKQLDEHTKVIETYIDELTEQLPELRHFILPGGGEVGAFLQLARTVSRRVERIIVSLSQETEV